MTSLKLAFSRANFLILHYAYFIVLTFVSSIILWGSSRPSFAVSYVDSLFLVVSAISGTGLNTVNLSGLTTWQQVLLLLLIMLGGSTLVSIWTNAVRRRIFVRRRYGRGGGSGGERGDQTTTHCLSNQKLAARSCHSLVFYLFKQVDQIPAANENQKASTITTAGADLSGQLLPVDHAHLAKRSPEYHAFTVLGVFVRLYYVLWQLLGCLALGAWIANRSPQTAEANRMNPWWVGIFNGISAFNNSGLSLLDANVAPFQKTPFVIVTMGLMILAGNTMYPIFLRFILWSVWRLLRNTAIIPIRGLTNLEEALDFILRHPRRFHTHLFPARHTWWLLFTVLLINTVGWVGFELINLRNPDIASIPVGYRIIDGLFQSISTRSGGFSVASMSTVYPSTRLLYIFMMYIPVLPVIISRHRFSKSHEKKKKKKNHLDDGPHSDAHHCLYQSGTCTINSLTIARQSTSPEVKTQAIENSAPTLCEEPGTLAIRKRQDDELLVDFIWRQMHHHFAQDVWMLSLAVFLISVIENKKLVDDPMAYNVFNIVFEVVSGYHCVGVSTGLPTAAYSFSGGWQGASKVILCFVMMFGRHGLLPLKLEAYDEEDDCEEDEG